ncbi:cell division protein FtsL [Candidatus Pelagibacter sp.]|jgi:cell division protein FtsL|nr:cell division protein FtsL [Candidatus Pelagibacter sp.]
MKKVLVIFLILFLILFTAIVKNSTKRIDDKILVKQENISGLNKELGDIKLEHEYLSSAEKLLAFQNLYFEDELVKKDIQEIIIIDKEIERFDFK